MIEIYDLTVPRHKKEAERISFYQCGIEHCMPGHFNGPRVRLHMSIHIVLEGCGCLVINKKEYRVCEGQAFLVPANMNVYYCSDAKNPWKYCWIDFLGTEKERYSELIFGKENYVKTVFAVQSIYNLIKETAEKFCDGQEMEKYGEKIHLYAVESLSQSLRANAVLYDVLSILLEENTSGGNEAIEYIDKIKNYMDHNFLEIDEVSELAESFHLHPNYFTAIFKEKYHVPPKKYLLERKINYASQLLLKTDDSIQYIAQLCGFASISSFGKIYKKYKNISPAGFRKQNR